VAVDFEVTEVVDQTQCISGMIPKSLFADGQAASYWYHDDAAKLATAADPARK
jgi:predicted naringenin-chalcone synthase